MTGNILQAVPDSGNQSLPRRRLGAEQARRLLGGEIIRCYSVCQDHHLRYQIPGRAVRLREVNSDHTLLIHVNVDIRKGKKQCAPLSTRESQLLPDCIEQTQFLVTLHDSVHLSITELPFHLDNTGHDFAAEDFPFRREFYQKTDSRSHSILDQAEDTLGKFPGQHGDLSFREVKRCGPFHGLAEQGIFGRNKRADIRDVNAHQYFAVIKTLHMQGIVIVTG